MTQKKFSTTWKRSRQPRKQHLYRHNAPLHVRQKMMSAHLSPELRKKYGKRNIQLRKGDKVKVLCGKFKKKEGKVERINLKRERVIITGMEHTKKDGSKVAAVFHPSNLMIVLLELGDRKRKIKAGEHKKIEPAGESKTEGGKSKESRAGESKTGDKI